MRKRSRRSARKRKSAKTPIYRPFFNVKRVANAKCTRKNSYVSADAAERVAADRSDATGDDIQAYKCDACAWWHITNRSRRRRERGR